MTLIIENENGRHNMPEVPKELKEKYKLAGQWPPPKGITVLVEELPSSKTVYQLLANLARLVSPEQRKVVDQAQKTLTQGINK